MKVDPTDFWEKITFSLQSPSKRSTIRPKVNQTGYIAAS